METILWAAVLVTAALLLLRAIGLADWFQIQIGFLFSRRSPEWREIKRLRRKLRLLKALTRIIGRTERRLAALEHEPPARAYRTSDHQE